ncbi:MAG TPA: hypothetical protein VEC58_00295 [Roseiarcus sp.]|nr:hypothetical protein [Roseiarcus sp.]
MNLARVTARWSGVEFAKPTREVGEMRPAVSAGALLAALLAGLIVSTPAKAGEADQAPPGPQAAQPAAGQDDGVVKTVLKALNIASDPGEPKDFVRAARPASPDSEGYVPVFKPTSEHKAKLLTPDQLKGLEGELDAAQTRGGQIRDAFPPARRAYLESEKAKADKAAAKRNKPAAASATQ